MSDTQSFEKFSAEMLNVVANLTQSLVNANKKQAGNLDSLYVDAEKPYMQLASLYDGGNMKCYTKEELEKSVTDSIRSITTENKIDPDKINTQELIKAGLKWNDLSFSDKKRLLSGKETSTITINLKDNKNNRLVRGSLSLKGNPDNTFSFAFKQAQNQNTRKRFIKI
jgi:hypothetical protein